MTSSQSSDLSEHWTIPYVRENPGVALLQLRKLKAEVERLREHFVDEAKMVDELVRQQRGAVDLNSEPAGQSTLDTIKALHAKLDEVRAERDNWRWLAERRAPDHPRGAV